MTLQLSADQVRSMQAHAEAVYPQECCGILLGALEDVDMPQAVHIASASSSGQNIKKILIEVRPTQNIWDHDSDPFAPAQVAESLTQARRYQIDPKDLLQAQRDARDLHLHILGIYHSHPDHPAVPSECDRAQAWPQYSYIILSVQQGKAQDPKSWVLNPQHQFEAEEILIN